MTKRDLKQLYYIKKEIAMWKEKLNKLNNKSFVGVPPLTGMPNGSGITSNKVEDIAVKKDEIEKIITELSAKLRIQEQNIMKYIDKIDDSVIRQIMHYRYIDCLSWRQISYRIYQRWDKASAVRMALDRFLKK